jgi:hypothetical protein
MTEKKSELKEQLNLTNELIQVVLGKDTFFKSTRELFNKYWKELQKKRSEIVTQEIHHYSGEALAKFWQLDFLLERIKQLELQMESRRQETILNGDPVQNWIQKTEINKNKETPAKPNIDDLKEMINSMKDTSIYEMELYTECFYYVSHRLKKIIDYYPGLKDFKPLAVINVRNNLIEHPHGIHGVTFPSFGLGNPNGPVIKGARTEEEKNKSVDHGLYKNALEYRELLEAVLHQGLHSLSR